MRLSRNVAAFVRSARVAHLATADEHGRPHVIPVCFIFDGHDLYFPIDEKPKTTPPLRLKRMRNILMNPQVALVVDRYHENWKRLAYVLITGTAELLLKGKRHHKAVLRLRRKYPQYLRMALPERPIIRIAPTRWIRWGAL